MATNRAYMNPQAFYEAYGVIIGLQGDPANQVVAEKGTLVSDAFDLIGTGTGWSRPDTTLDNLFWSRLLLVEMLVPSDTTYLGSKLALVARPRSLWMYDKGGNILADFIGNSVAADNLGRNGYLTEITKVNPPYRLGDVIRIGTLSAPITLETFTDGFEKSLSPSETYDGTVARVPTIGAPGFTAVSILGADYNANLYSNFSITEVLYYDKNVDARTRIVGSSTPAGETVTLSLCIGGVTSVYEVTGQRLA